MESANSPSNLTEADLRPPSPMTAAFMPLGLDESPDDGFLLSALASLERTVTNHSHNTSTRDSSDYFYTGFEPPAPNTLTGNGARASTAQEQTRRKRSSIACQPCHNRRVRCDAAAGGRPCSNCRFRDLDCVLINSKRTRYVDPRLSVSLIVSHKSHQRPWRSLRPANKQRRRRTVQAVVSTNA